MENPKQIDNVKECVADDLKSRLSANSKVSIAAASFSIYAFEVLKEQLENIEELRFHFHFTCFPARTKVKKEMRVLYTETQP